MVALTILQKAKLRLLGFKIVDVVSGLIAEIGLLPKHAFNTSTPTGADPTVALTAGQSKSYQIIAPHGTAPTGAITLLLPETADQIGREITVENNSVLTVTVKGKADDTGVAIATTKTAKVVIKATNVAKRLIADI